MELKEKILDDLNNENSDDTSINLEFLKDLRDVLSHYKGKQFKLNELMNDLKIDNKNNFINLLNNLGIRPVDDLYSLSVHDVAALDIFIQNKEKYKK